MMSLLLVLPSGKACFKQLTLGAMLNTIIIQPLAAPSKTVCAAEDARFKNLNHVYHIKHHFMMRIHPIIFNSILLLTI